jgi:hypothetical protein
MSGSPTTHVRHEAGRCGAPPQRSRPNGPRVTDLADRESPLWPLQRLPQPEPRPRLPVRVDFARPRHVKAAQVVWGSGRGALVLALTGVAYWLRPHGRQHRSWQWVKRIPRFVVDSTDSENHERGRCRTFLCRKQGDRIKQNLER